MVLWPLVLYIVLAVVLAAAMIGIPQLLGERHRQPGTQKPYESGMLSTGGTGARFSMQFYLFALFFLVFDLEAVFLYAWAVAAPKLGWIGYLEVVVFVVVLLVALLYLWRDGALDWGTTAYLKRHPRRAHAGFEADPDHAPAPATTPTVEGAQP